MRLRAAARAQKGKQAENSYANLEVSLWADVTPWTEAEMQAWATWRNHTSWRVWEREAAEPAEKQEDVEAPQLTNQEEPGKS